MRKEGDAVIEDGLGPDHEEDKSEKFCGGNLAPLARTRSLGAVGHSYGRPLAAPRLRYADLSQLQKQEIKFPPRTFDYLRDDIRQNLIDLINFKISQKQGDPEDVVVEQTRLNTESVAANVTLCMMDEARD